MNFQPSTDHEQPTSWVLTPLRYNVKLDALLKNFYERTGIGAPCNADIKLLYFSHEIPYHLVYCPGTAVHPQPLWFASGFFSHNGLDRWRVSSGRFDLLPEEASVARLFILALGVDFRSGSSSSTGHIRPGNEIREPPMRYWALNPVPVPRKFVPHTTVRPKPITRTKSHILARNSRNLPRKSLSRYRKLMRPLRGKTHEFQSAYTQRLQNRTLFWLLKTVLHLVYAQLGSYAVTIFLNFARVGGFHRQDI